MGDESAGNPAGPSRCTGWLEPRVRDAGPQPRDSSNASGLFWWWGMPGAGYEVSWAGGLPVVVTPEEIDASNAAEFRQSLLSCANGSHPTLVVDMGGTAFCDSTGVHQLVRARARAIAAGGEVRLVIRTAQVLRLFAIMGIDRLFPVFATLAEAVAGSEAAAEGEVASPPARAACAPDPLAARHTQARPAPG